MMWKAWMCPMMQQIKLSELCEESLGLKPEPARTFKSEVGFFLFLKGVIIGVLGSFHKNF